MRRGLDQSTLRVVGAGFGRTGTLSLKLALERLGLGKCYHMFELKGPDVALWQQAWDEDAGTEFHWESILSDYTCVVDWPACQFWRPLLARYRDAKCVLSVRDPSSWYESTRKTIYEASKKLKQIEDPARQAQARMVYSIIWDGVFEGRFEERSFALQKFEQHIQEVTDEVPTHRLLKFDVKEGWKPLCEFLSVEIPDDPFPSENNPEDFARRVKGNKKVDPDR